MKIIGITGSSGSGKSTVSEIIAKELKANLIVADKIVKQMQNEKTDYYKEIVKVLGQECLDEKGDLNKKEVARLIFSDDIKREKINNLTQKYVVEEIKNQIKNADSEYVIIDVPLLIESNLNKMCDAVIAVICDENVKIERICKRDKIEAKDAKARLKAQKSNDFYIEHADYVIENNGGEYDKLLGRIGTILQEL